MALLSVFLVIVVILVAALFDSFEEAKEIVSRSKHVTLVDIRFSKVIRTPNQITNG